MQIFDALWLINFMYLIQNKSFKEFFICFVQFCHWTDLELRTKFCH